MEGLTFLTISLYIICQSYVLSLTVRTLVSLPQYRYEEYIEQLEPGSQLDITTDKSVTIEKGRAGDPGDIGNISARETEQQRKEREERESKIEDTEGYEI